MDTKFFSKILLFGEYSIIKGSKGLAIPCEKYFGVLKKSDQPDKIDEELRLNEFCDYLEGSGILSIVLDIKAFKADVVTGLYFDSNIPLGHGVGSSGALCASIYHRYAYEFEQKDEYSIKDLTYLQDLMALMESYYHGTSSGLDCLISLVNRPVFIEARNNLKITDVPDLDKFGKFYLLESGIKRKTAPLVHLFLNDYEKNKVFKENFVEFKQYTNEIIDSLLIGDKESFDSLMANISRLQYLHFEKMIPDNIKSIWLDGLERKNHYVKLCGAGGGGFFLVYSPENDISYKGKLIKLN